MKKFLIFFLLMFSSLSWSCILIEGELQINKDILKIHQKFKIDENYPYKTENFIVHVKLLSAKSSKEEGQKTHIIIRHPKTFKILIEAKVNLAKGSEKTSTFSNDKVQFISKLTLKHI